jgi:hypothetical protein
MYAERLRRIYMDQLRLELPSAVQYKPGLINLRGTQILDPSGNRIWVYYRPAQRRVPTELDGQICFSEAEIGVKVPPDGDPIGTLKPPTKAVFEARTVEVKPWWLYADYRASSPSDRLDSTWRARFGIELEQMLFVEPGTKTPLTTVRVCKEEAQTADTGKVYASGRFTKKTDPIPPGRLSRPPNDTPFATANAGKRVSCLSNNGVQSSVECGCGVGLERCLPTAPGGFVTVADAPLGITQPFNKAARPAHLWMLGWLAEEPIHFMDRIFTEDRDVRELLTGRASVINGPLGLFYRTMANATCCGQGTDLGYVNAEPLFAPTAVPNALVPHDVNRWEVVADRGPHAAGLMTMPVFLRKYGSARQRAHAIYNTFLCKEFVAETPKLQASEEKDLAKRPGCRACHTRLEPMAAYFSRVQDQDWTYLPKTHFPVENAKCANPMNAACKQYYDPVFTDGKRGVLRSAYNAPAHADLGPVGFAQEVTQSPDFAACVVRTVAQSFLGRPLVATDEAWRTSLVKTFVDGGYRAKPLVRAIVKSTQYRQLEDRKSP